MARLNTIVLIISIALACVLAKEELYSDRYDNVNIEDILNNEKIREQYYNCFMGTAPCKTPDAKFFKDMFGEAFLTQCKKCTEKQKVMIDTTVTWFTENKPDQWEALVAKMIADKKADN